MKYILLRTIRNWRSESVFLQLQASMAFSNAFGSQTMAPSIDELSSMLEMLDSAEREKILKVLHVR